MLTEEQIEQNKGKEKRFVVEAKMNKDIKSHLLKINRALDLHAVTR